MVESAAIYFGLALATGHRQRRKRMRVIGYSCAFGSDISGIYDTAGVLMGKLWRVRQASTQGPKTWPVTIIRRGR